MTADRRLAEIREKVQTCTRLTFDDGVYLDRHADLFTAAFQVDYVVLGGGNARHMKSLPAHVRLGSNANAFTGGFRMWDHELGLRTPR